MLNKGMLLCRGTDNRVGGGIGIAGGQGFGVGVYPGDSADLTAIGLRPMSGCEDPASPNYGNYEHTLGSVMVFIPAFCYRIGRPTAPSYSRDGANAIEIRGAELGEGNGWILHRAFIDGGQRKLGFFIDKFLCSKKSGNSNIAVSVKKADQLVLGNKYTNSLSMPGCEGYVYDAITLSRARGEAYACVSVFQWSALSMLALAHGQAATSTLNCAWFDSNYVINFPKGSNSYGKDYNDRSITFTTYSYSSDISKTGSGNPFNKTTHNGQNCGVADVRGCMGQVLIGVVAHTRDFFVVNDTYKMHDMTKDNFSNTTSNFDSISGVFLGDGYWGNGANCVFIPDSAGIGRALCGVFPSEIGTSKEGTDLFGKTYISLGAKYENEWIISTAGTFRDTASGIWWRSLTASDSPYAGGEKSFRAAGYAN